MDYPVGGRQSICDGKSLKCHRRNIPDSGETKVEIVMLTAEIL